MSTKSEDDEQLHDTRVASASALPAYLCSPIREIAGPKLFEYKLRRAFIKRLPSRAWSAVSPRLNFVKKGEQVRLQEALTMEFIARNTTIPVARVLDVFSYQGTIHIVQERINGPVLEDVWHLLSPEEKQSCLMQIKDILQQLRSLKPPHPDRVEAVDGSCLNDWRVTGDSPWGPFDSHDKFHQILYRNDDPHYPEATASIGEALSKIAGRKYRSVFSHGDFGPHNMILKDGRIFIIDWEMAGWFPEYWEYARAHAARGSFTVWWDAFKEVIDQYDDEREVQIRFAHYYHGFLG